MLVALESQGELDTLRPELLPPEPTVAPTTHPQHEPDADLP